MSKLVRFSDYQPLLDSFVSLLRQSIGDNLVSIILYGSVARDQATLESDVDLLLILNETSQVYFERLQVLLPLLRKLRQDPAWKNLTDRGIYPALSVLILSREEANQNRYLYLDMIEDARILLDQDGFFQNRLVILKKRLQELGAKKVIRDGSWYWDLKPDLKPDEVVTL
jgi:predicted nucleotidyltransferase